MPADCYDRSMGADELSDDLVFRGAIVALTELRRQHPDNPLYRAYNAAALAWVNEAQERLEKANNTDAPA